MSISWSGSAPLEPLHDLAPLPGVLLTAPTNDRFCRLQAFWPSMCCGSKNKSHRITSNHGRATSGAEFQQVSHEMSIQWDHYLREQHRATIHQAGLHIEVILWYLVTCQTEPNLPRISLVRSLKQFSREPACDQVEPGQHCIALHSTADGWLMYSSSLSLGDCTAPPPSWCFSASIRFFQNLLKQ